MAVVDFNNPTGAIALPNLDIKVCQITDFTCTNPAMGNPELPGLFEVMQNIPQQPPPLFAVGLPTAVEANFYLRLNAPGFLQTEYYFVDELRLNLEGPLTPAGPPRVLGETITLPQEGRIDEFFAQVADANIVRDPNAGIVAFRTFDCLGNRAEGVRLEIIGREDGPEFPWVFKDSAPTPGTATDGQGVAGFANVESAPSRFTVRGITPEGEPYGEVTVNVRPSTLTFAEIRPDGAYFRSVQQRNAYFAAQMDAGSD